MVPRFRHRIGIETLRRELDAVHASNAAAAAAANNNNHTHHRHSSSSNSQIVTPPSPASSTSYTTFEDTAWTLNGYLTIPVESTEYSHYNSSPVGDKIPGFRTSAGMFSHLTSSF